MFDLLLVGHLCKDRIISADGEISATGGAVLYGSLPAALHGISVGVLTKVAAADRPLLREIEQAGISVVALPSAATTSIQIVAKSDDFERRRFVVDAVADPFTVEDLAGVSARVALVCPLMRGEFPVAGLEALAAHCEVGLDVQGFIRCREGEGLASRPWPQMERALAHVTYLKTDLREAEVLTGCGEIAEAAGRLAALGPREVVITHARGVFVHAAGETHECAFDARSTVGRTGRGDTTIASYIARRASSAPGPALQGTVAVVSRKLETPGPFRGPLP